MGLMIGVVAGYFSRLESFLTGTADVVMTVPAFPLLILVGLLFPDTALTIAAMLILVLWPPVARAIRSQVLSVKSRPYVDAARTSGMGDLSIVFRVIIPEVASIAFAYFVITVAISVVFVVGLEFVGVGNVDEVTWGSIFYWAQQIGAYNGAWWWVLAPGVFVIMFAAAFAMIGYAVEEAVNPRLRV